MIASLEPKMDDVYDVVLVANTPAYLYKKLRRVLFDIANSTPLQTLISELRREVASPPSDDYDQASYVYALFILITYGRSEDVHGHLVWIKSINMKWMDYLINHYERNIIAPLSSITHSISTSLIRKSNTGQSSHDQTTVRISL